MRAQRERAGSLLASGIFWLGLGFILTAPLMNLGYERMTKSRLSGNGSEVMPEFMVSLYNTGGRSGVTLFFVTIGGSLLLFALLRQRPKSRPVEPSSARNGAPRVYHESSPNEPGPVATASGQMVLQTRKYLS
jgi:hypothetical protein